MTTMKMFSSYNLKIAVIEGSKDIGSTTIHNTFHAKVQLHKAKIFITRPFGEYKYLSIELFVI